MTTLDRTSERRFKIPTMAEIKQSAENVRQDARALWLPVTSVAGIVVVLLGAGMWIERTNSRSANTVALAEQLQAVEKAIEEKANNTNQRLDRMQGSVDALMQMQATVAETKAEVGSLGSRLDSMDTAIATQNAWIATTRERLSRQGFETPDFNPPGTGGN